MLRSAVKVAGRCILAVIELSEPSNKGDLNPERFMAAKLRCFIVRSAPQLAVVHSGTNVILTWPTNFTAFTLQSTTNLVAPSVWDTVSPPAVVVNGQNTETNSIVGARKFY